MMYRRTTLILGVAAIVSWIAYFAGVVYAEETNAPHTPFYGAFAYIALTASFGALVFFAIGRQDRRAAVMTRAVEAVVVASPQSPAPAPSGATGGFAEWHPPAPGGMSDRPVGAAGVPRPRIVEPTWDGSGDTMQITMDGSWIPFGVKSEAELPDGVAKQIFELGRRVGRRDAA